MQIRWCTDDLQSANTHGQKAKEFPARVCEQLSPPVAGVGSVLASLFSENASLVATAGKGLFLSGRLLLGGPVKRENELVARHRSSLGNRGQNGK